jgi:hypothetical protein
LEGDGMVLRGFLFAVAAMLATISPAAAEWSVTASGSLFYTDDVALFSATRRSGIDGDPSQPVLDTSHTGFGSDMVFEPRTAFSIKPQGFIYTLNPEFSQASVAVEALHSFTPNTAIRLRYFTAPDQLLGMSEERRIRAARTALVRGLGSPIVGTGGHPPIQRSVRPT